MGVRRLRVTKYGFWGQNDVVLAFLKPKQRRFGIHNFFLKFYIYQNDVILDSEISKRHHFESVVIYLKQRRLDK